MSKRSFDIALLLSNSGRAKSGILAAAAGLAMATALTLHSTPAHAYQTSALSLKGFSSSTFGLSAATLSRNGMVESVGLHLDGSIWDTTSTQWNTVQLAAPGSAAIGGGIAAVSRSPTMIDVFWVGQDGSVQHASLTDGATPQITALYGSGSAAINGSITAISRASNTMELFWSGADGSVQHAWYYDGQGWNSWPLAPAGSTLGCDCGYAPYNPAMVSASVSSSTIDVYWITPNGSIENAFLDASKSSAWTFTTLGSPSIASTSGGIAVVPFNPGPNNSLFGGPQLNVVFYGPDRSIQGIAAPPNPQNSSIPWLGPIAIEPANTALGVGMLSAVATTPTQGSVFFTGSDNSLKWDSYVFGTPAVQHVTLNIGANNTVGTFSGVSVAASDAANMDVLINLNSNVLEDIHILEAPVIPNIISPTAGSNTNLVEPYLFVSDPGAQSVWEATSFVITLTPSSPSGPSIQFTVTPNSNGQWAGKPPSPLNAAIWYMSVTSKNASSVAPNTALSFTVVPPSAPAPPIIVEPANGSASNPSDPSFYFADPGTGTTSAAIQFNGGFSGPNGTGGQTVGQSLDRIGAPMRGPLSLGYSLPNGTWQLEMWSTNALGDSPHVYTTFTTGPACVPEGQKVGSKQCCGTDKPTLAGICEPPDPKNCGLVGYAPPNEPCCRDKTPCDPHGSCVNDDGWYCEANFTSTGQPVPPTQSQTGGTNRPVMGCLVWCPGFADGVCQFVGLYSSSDVAEADYELANDLMPGECRACCGVNECESTAPGTGGYYCNSQAQAEISQLQMQ